jgi:HAD superfamily hydrolase (TIGR01549 family)
LIRGIVFDLDGTLADSRLDFDAMRREMDLPPDGSILEAIDRLDMQRAAQCRAVLHRHEQEGLARATLLSGVAELLTELDRRAIRRAIATRNSRQVTDATLVKLGLAVDFSLTREDGPVKPDPWAVQHACERWQLSPAEVLVVGDYRYDVESGRAAGCRTVLLTRGPNPAAHPNREGADLVLQSLADYPRLLAWLDVL